MLLHHWRFWARPDQLPPPGRWTSWLLLGGRGAGKTRAGAEWVRSRVEGRTPLAPGRCCRVALIGETLLAAREVMVEGPSGLRAIAPSDTRPTYVASRHILVWPNGAIAQLFSAERPESLRGPQFDLAWCDELAKWRHDEATWDMLQFGLRLGRQPQQAVTTTPRPTRLLKRLLRDKRCVVSRAATRANAAHLAPGFLEEIMVRYEGSRLGRQELDAELIEDVPGALWSPAELDEQRVEAAPALQRLVVAVDPPASSGPKADRCGVIVAGRSADGAAYVLEDASVQGLSPSAWAAHVAAVYRRHRADRLVAEINQGGDLIQEVVLQAARDMAFRPVRATRGKWVRAEPVAALYERGLVHHVGRMRALEDEMCRYDGSGGASPDRMDALVWALTDLMLRRERPRRPTLRRL